MIHICVMDYPNDKTQLHLCRPRHRDYMCGLLSARKAIAAGSFVSDDGGLFIYEAESHAEAMRAVTQDPYVIEGVVLTWKLREYELHGLNAEMLLGAVAGNDLSK